MTPVVVGIDGSARGLAAVQVAATEAALRHRALRIVHALIWEPPGVEADLAIAPPAHHAYRNRAEAYATEAVALAGTCALGLDITSEVIAGTAAAVLLAESRSADLLVLGERGLGGLAELLLGSVAMQAATHGSGPVLIVRGEQRPEAPVVVGADGSADSQAAIAFATEEAVMRGVELVALHAWSGGAETQLDAELPLTSEFWSGDDEERRVLAESLAGIAEKYPDLRIRRQVQRGSARRLLTDWSNTAQLVVVGSRGHGGFAGLMLGSVGQQLVHHAGCPVAVVRQPRRAGLSR